MFILTRTRTGCSVIFLICLSVIWSDIAAKDSDRMWHFKSNQLSMDIPCNMSSHDTQLSSGFSRYGPCVWTSCWHFCPQDLLTLSGTRSKRDISRTGWTVVFLRNRESAWVGCQQGCAIHLTLWFLLLSASSWYGQMWDQRNALCHHLELANTNRIKESLP